MAEDTRIAQDTSADTTTRAASKTPSVHVAHIVHGCSQVCAMSMLGSNIIGAYVLFVFVSFSVHSQFQLPTFPIYLSLLSSNVAASLSSWSSARSLSLTWIRFSKLFFSSYTSFLAVVGCMIAFTLYLLPVGFLCKNSPRLTSSRKASEPISFSFRLRTSGAPARPF